MGKFTLEVKFRYSSAPKFSRKNLVLKIGVTVITVLDSNLNEIVIHERLYEDLPRDVIN